MDDPLSGGRLEPDARHIYLQVAPALGKPHSLRLSPPAIAERNGGHPHVLHREGPGQRHSNERTSTATAAVQNLLRFVNIHVQGIGEPIRGATSTRRSCTTLTLGEGVPARRD